MNVSQNESNHPLWYYISVAMHFAADHIGRFRKERVTHESIESKALVHPEAF